MPYKDPEAKKEYDKQYRIDNAEKKKEQRKKYYDKNAEKIKAKNRIRNIIDAEKNKEYRQTPQGIKSNRISGWRRRGVLDHFNDNYGTLYKIYQSTKFCDDCGYVLITGDIRFRKCLDHCHKSGYFRGIVCHCCNIKRA